MSKLFLSLILLVWLIAPGQALAYLDPGTGSALIQMLVAAVMGGLFVLRMYWRKLVTLFKGASPESYAAASAVSDDEQG